MCQISRFCVQEREGKQLMSGLSGSKCGFDATKDQERGTTHPTSSPSGCLLILGLFLLILLWSGISVFIWGLFCLILLCACVFLAYTGVREDETLVRDHIESNSAWPG